MKGLGVKLFILGVILAAATAYGQSARPGLSEVVRISDPVAGEILVTSPDHHVFASRFSFCGEFVQIPSFSFTVFRDDGQIQSRGEGLRIPGQFTAVSNRGELWVVGIQCSEGKPLAKIRASGELAWRAALNSVPRAIAVDGAGRGIVTGVAGGSAVVEAIDPETGAPQFTVQFGGERTGCASAGGCAASTTPAAIATGDDGTIYVAGVTNAIDFPVTSNAAHSACPDCATDSSRGFLVRLSPAGRILYATYLPFAPGVISLAVDRRGGAYVAVSAQIISGNASVEAFGPTGAEIYRVTIPFTVTSISADGDGRVIGLKPMFFPNPPVAFRLGPSGELDGYGTLFTGSALTAVPLGDSVVGIVNAAPPFLYRWVMAAAREPAVTHLASSTGQRAIAQVAPGGLLSFYGSALGPTVGQAATFDANGRLPLQLGGVRVLIDGKQATLLYASDQQVNAVVPWGVSDAARVQLCAEVCAPAVDLLVVPSEPNWFTEAPPSDLSSLGRVAIAFNRDGSRNSEQSPARPGSAMTLFVSGAGQAEGGLQDGAIGVPGQGRPLLPIQLTMDVDALWRGTLYNGPRTVAPDVLYAGSLAQTANEVLQMNIRLPEIDVPTVHSAQLLLEVGGAKAPSAAIFVSNSGR
jgi:uncharacterized protein (TIGR03437 family)